jgi:hypothetical protein
MALKIKDSFATVQCDLVSIEIELELAILATNMAGVLQSHISSKPLMSILNFFHTP